MKLKPNDIVLTHGKTKHLGKKDSINRVLAQVIEVGKYDVFLKKISKDMYGANRPFICSINRCQKIELKDIDLYSEPVRPEIGNLVISIFHDITSQKKSVGILEKIIDIPSSKKMAEIRSSDKKVVVPYESLIILE